jgi:hypothetical protein
MPSLDASLSGAAANAYVTYARAETVLDDLLIVRTAWNAATVNDRERALMAATSILDARVSWLGSIAVQTQALGWPRVGVVDGEGRTIADGSIPGGVERATVALAALLLEAEAQSAGSGTYEETGKIKRMKAGSMEIEFRDRVTVEKLAASLPVDVTQYLGGLALFIGGAGANWRPVVRV